VLRIPFLLRKNPDERDERAQDHDGLKADRANDPLQNVGLHFGNIGFEFGPYFGEIGPKCRQIRLGGKIIMARFPQGFGERLGLLGREMALVPQRAGEAKGVEEKSAHPRNME
jgi:hypothetical protein